MPAAVHTQEALRAALASGKPTPLDALTPYGKREAIRRMVWRENKMVSFSYVPLTRELDHEQLAAVLRFLDLDYYLPMLDNRLVGPPLRLPAPSEQVEQDLHLLRQFEDEDHARRAEATAPATEIGAPAVLRRYQELFGARLNPATLTAQPLGDLLPLFDAAALAANDNPASPALDDMLWVHRELTARGIDTRRTLDYGVLYAMLAARRFEQARAFAATRPHLADLPIPQVVDPLGSGFKGRSAFAYDAQSNTLTRQALPSPSGTELVMVVGAGCHNSDNALQAIHDDAALQARLRGANLLLVSAPNAPIETHLITEWNAANPAMPIRAPFSVQEWQAIEVTGIPSFYLLRNGKVVDQRKGWPDEGKAELVKLIDAAAQ
ncbi:hypothetical protein [Massilia horti]|uniref:Thioredoxin domain-containing protein n=1 Tax=Massilia horti TaxID=2562153 RepID=A0A4Y9SNG5_9BURK|nr:hypothetical protein [Massilia horti]TFW28252.1 hypothetical protein E4O92_21625 [Massilia horti]